MLEIFVLLLELKVLKLVILLLILKIQRFKTITIDEPTMSMLFTMILLSLVKKGKFVTSRHIRDRLTKELEKNLAMKLVKLILLINLWFWSWCTSLICSY
jgi:hypothetical protein